MANENDRTSTGAESGHAVASSRPAFPGYEVLSELGRGGMGVVYLARQLSLKRLVALKVVRSGCHASLKERARFRTEAEAVARLQHANIVRIYEVSENDGVPYLSLEFIDGFNLDHLGAGRPMAFRQAGRIVETLARAMHYAHQQGIVHRDLKPSNVLFDSTTSEDVPKITDFGLAKLLDAEPAHAPTEAVIGTPSYMAPEQACGNGAAIGPATDIYALGAILYELLTGEPPFHGDTPWEVVEKVRFQEPAPLTRLRRGVPRDLETICLKCLEKVPAKRFATAEDLAEDLRRFLAYEPIQARRASPWERSWKWAKRRPAAASLAAVSVLALLVVTMLQVRFQRDLDLRETETRVDERRTQLARLHQARARYKLFQDQRGDTVFQAVRAKLFPAADLAVKDTGRKAIEKTLSRLGVDADSPSASLFDPLWTDREKSEAASGCYQLLVLLAEAVAEPAPEQTPEDRRRQSLRAIKLLDHAARLVPGTRTYHLRRARFLLQQGDRAAAEREQQRAGEVPPAGMIDFFLLGEECYRAGDVKGARRNFQKALLAQPNDFWSQCFLAACHLQLGKAEEAEARVSNCISQRPDFLWTYLLRGLAHEQLNDLARAEHDFRTALKLGRDDDARYVIHVTRAALRFRRKLFQTAVDDLKEAIALRPGHYYAHVSLAGVYQAQERWQEANEHFEQALRLKPPPRVAAECHAQRSRNFHFGAEYANALRAAEASLSSLPDYAPGQLRRALALLELKRAREAGRCFDRYLVQGGAAGPEFYRGRGRARMDAGDFLGARDDYTRALEIEPGASLLAHRGWAYFFVDAWKPALRDFAEAIRKDPENGEAYIGRGLCHVMLGRHGEAAADAAEALARQPAAPEMMHNIACIFALAAGRIARNRPDDQQAETYRAQALKAVRQTLALLPAEQRPAFWRAKVLPDPALDSIRNSDGFKTLALRYADPLAED